MTSMYTTLIEVDELAQALAGRPAGVTEATGASGPAGLSARAGASARTDADGSWAIIDCRFDLAKPDWGAAAYSAGHIPQAVYAHLVP